MAGEIPIHGFATQIYLPSKQGQKLKNSVLLQFSQVDPKLYLAWTAHFLKNSDTSGRISYYNARFHKGGGWGVAKCSEGCLVNETLKSKNTGTYNRSCCRFVRSLGSLSNRVFERCTSTGSEVFSLYVCLDAN